MSTYKEEDSVAPLFRDDSENRRRACFPPVSLAPILAACSCVLYSVNGELLQALQSQGGGQISPLLNLILCHMGGLVFAPRFLFPQASGHAASSEALHVPNVPLLSLVLSFILMGYNYAWLLSARFLAVGLTNAIFQTSIAFVYLASVVLFNDTALAAPQIVGVGLSLAGSALASGVGGGAVASAPHTLILGIFLALSASIGCMMYQVCFKLMFGKKKNDAQFLAHVGAWVGVWHVAAILPLAWLASVTGFEVMQFPHGRLAIIGTMASAALASTVNAMYVCMVMWGSSMLLPCSAAFSVPLTVGLDALLHHVYPHRLEVCGHIMVVVSVVLILDVGPKIRLLLAARKRTLRSGMNP